MAIDSRREAAWKSAFEKGSKKVQANLRKIHAKNPEFQEFIDKHGFGVTLSKKKAENQGAKRPSSSPTVKPTSPAHPEAKKGPVDRLAAIKQAAEKRKLRNQAASNRIAWGGELGGSFQMPGSSFRRYSESLHEARKKILGFPVEKKTQQLPAPKEGHPVPVGYERVKDNMGFNILRKKVAERFELMKPILAEGRDDEGRSWDSAIVRTRFGGIKTPKHKKDQFLNKLRRVARKKIKKVLATEYTDMSSKEALQELKKSTYASYLQKAPSRIRSGTSIAKGFEDDYYYHMKTANKHSPNVMDFPPKKKDPEKLKSAEASMKVAKELQTDFQRRAAKRIAGVQRAGRLLTREEVEEILDESNTLARPEIWKTHELRHESGKVLKKGDKVKDFRGDEHEVLGFAPPHKESSSGRVYTKSDGREGSFFPGVINASIHKKSAVKEGFVGLYKAKRQAMFEAKTEETVAPEVVAEEQVVEEVRKPDYRDVRRALLRKGK